MDLRPAVLFVQSFANPGLLAMVLMWGTQIRGETDDGTVKSTPRRDSSNS
jgi:hypothetical protein